MRTILTRLVLAALLLVPLPAFAQTSLNSTTLSSAVNATTTTIALTSGTNVSAGDILFVDREAMKVNSISGTIARVTRGVRGTAARAHAALAITYTGADERFYQTEAVGTCTATSELYTPRIVTPTGNVYVCQNSAWTKVGADVGTFVVSCRYSLPADMVDNSCFTADRDYVVTKILYVHKTPESGGTLTVIPRRQESTEAPASGDALATAINAVATVAETVTTATLTATASLLILDAGDRLGIDFTDDAAGELAGVVVSFVLTPR